MTLVLPRRVAVAVAAIERLAADQIPTLVESHNHTWHSHVFAARFDVTSCSVPLTSIDHIRGAVRALDDFPCAIGAARWSCTALGRAVLEIDVCTTGDDAEAPPRLRLTNKRDRDADDESALVPTKVAHMEAPLVPSLPSRARELLRMSYAQLRNELGDLEHKFLDSLDVCRVPRVRAAEVNRCVQQFDAALVASRHGYAAVRLLLRPLILDDAHSPCTCIEVATIGPVSVRVDDLARTPLPHPAFYRADIWLRHSEICMTLTAVSPKCPIH